MHEIILKNLDLCREQHVSPIILLLHVRKMNADFPFTKLTLADEIIMWVAILGICRKHSDENPSVDWIL